MKKKIGDLTLKELQKLERLECNKHEHCFDCPFDVVIRNVIEGGAILGSKCNIYLDDNRTNLEEEIEVDE